MPKLNVCSVYPGGVRVVGRGSYALGYRVQLHMPLGWTTLEKWDYLANARAHAKRLSLANAPDQGKLTRRELKVVLDHVRALP